MIRRRNRGRPHEARRLTHAPQDAGKMNRRGRVRCADTETHEAPRPKLLL